MPCRQIAHATSTLTSHSRLRSVAACVQNRCHRSVRGQRRMFGGQVRTCASRVAWQDIHAGDGQKPWPPRSGHCLATMPKDSAGDALVFGGYTEDKQKQRTATNDSWLFSYLDKTWTEYKTEDSPVPRARIAAQAVRVGTHVWLIGGWDPGTKGDGGEILSDVWRLDLNASQWSQAAVQAVAVGSVIYIHTHRSLQDILALDVSNPDKPELQLQPVSSTSGATPPARGLHSCTITNGKLYLFGGASQQGKMMNDLWTLDLDSKQWTELHPEGDLPHIRCSHTAIAVGSSVVIFGGSYYREDGSGLQPLDDVIIYDTEHNRWQQPAVNGTKPRARNAAVACMVSDTEMLLHGGWNPFKETYDDSFLLKVQS